MHQRALSMGVVQALIKQQKMNIATLSDHREDSVLYHNGGINKIVKHKLFNLNKTLAI
jgi:hypothetical protein